MADKTLGPVTPDESPASSLTPPKKQRFGSASCEVTRVLRTGSNAKAGQTRSEDHTRAVEKGDTAQTRVEMKRPLPTASGSGRPDGRTLSLTDANATPLGSLPSISPAGQNYTKALESMITGYEILEEMPRGGQAAVYKAIHTATKTTVAIKVLLPTLLASARARFYFEREAELIASLDHPNIIAIRDSGIIHQQYYFVMQYVEGQPLERYVRLHKLSFREIIILFKKICTAVSYAHQQGIIHRDLKSANILVDERGEPHVLDFGLAKAVGLDEQSTDKAVATVTGQLAGTLSTMSPEQAAGRPDLIDVRTDVYSLGVILYHLLTGEYPYDVSGSTLKALKNIQETEPVRPRQMDRKFDSDMEAILLTALAKDPAARYQSAAELKSDIQHWLEGRPIQVRSISTSYLLRKIIARHRYTTTVAVLLLLIVLAFAYTSFDLYVTAQKARQVSEDKANSLSAQIATTNNVVRLFAFNTFLENWRQDRPQEAALSLAYLSKGTKEQRAAIFLANPQSVADKEAEFRQAITDEYGWFVDYIIGENHLKNGDRAKAFTAFKRSQETLPGVLLANSLSVDSWLIGQVQNRLRQLSENDKPKVDIKATQ